MAFIASLAVDAQGKLWVAEGDYVPKRFSCWDTKSGQLVKEFFGPTTYGALGGAINPQDPYLMVGQGCEWRIDPEDGPSRLFGRDYPRRHGSLAVRHRLQRQALPGSGYPLDL